jgi:hypothetical protein
MATQSFVQETGKKQIQVPSAIANMLHKLGRMIPGRQRYTMRHPKTAPTTPERTDRPVNFVKGTKQQRTATGIKSRHPRQPDTTPQHRSYCAHSRVKHGPQNMSKRSQRTGKRRVRPAWMRRENGWSPKRNTPGDGLRAGQEFIRVSAT